MAKIYPKLQALIDSKQVMLLASEGAAEMISRRKLVQWNIRDDKGDYRVAKETIERMNRRAEAGHSFDAAAMQKVARQPKGAVVAQTAPAAQAPVAATPPKPTKAKRIKKPVVAKPSTPPAPPALPVTPPPPQPPKLSQGEDTHVILVFDESGSMGSQHKEINAQAEAIRQRLVVLLPNALVEVCRFGSNTFWDTAQKAQSLPTIRLGSDKGMTSLYLATTEAAQRAIASNKPSLVYLLTDGDPCNDRGTINAASSAVAQALASNRITFACVGPAAAASFFKSCGIPDACVRKWDGVDKQDLNVVTQQAAQGVSSYAATRSAGKAKMDSFFVDVVAQNITPDRVRKELRDITSSLRRRKIQAFVALKDFVEKELKLTLVPGAGYYPLQKAEVLKVGRRIIVQPRGEDSFYAGPAARKLLGLPEDRDVKVEPKNLGELIVYFQSASPTRRLLPGTVFLYDESHVPGATAPTWSYADRADAAKKAS
jgi:hypothetical protein